MRGTYHPLLTLVAVLVGIVGSFVALDLFAHGGSARGRARSLWLAGGVLTTALAIWSVHYVGMLSLRVRAGSALVPIGYDIPRMLLPILVAGVAAGLSAAIIARFGTGIGSRVAAGVGFGAAIVGAHYAAMLSIRVPARLEYDRLLVLASIAFGCAGAVAVLASARHLGSDRPRVRERVVTALLSGATIAATHYTAIGATRFSPSGGAIRLESRQLLATDGVAALVGAVVLLILAFALLSVTLDRRTRTQGAAAERFSRLYRDAQEARLIAEESEQRFRTLADTGPAMVWLAGPGGERTFVGTRWAEFTGLGERATDGAPWDRTIDPEDRSATLAAHRDACEARRPFQLEYRIRRADGTCRWVLDSGLPRHDALGSVVGYVGTCIDITDRREVEEAQRFLSEAARVLATSLEFDAILGHVTRLAVPRLGDYCQVHLRNADGTIEQVAAAHVDPAAVPLLEEFGRRYRPDPTNADSLVARALRTGGAVLAPTDPVAWARRITSDPRTIRVVEELAPHSALVVPLVAHGERLGTMTFAMSAPGRRHEERDRVLAETFTSRAALALDNARLYTDLRRARDETVRTSRLEAELMRTRLEALRAQLNPHFLFNALNTIAMLVRRQAKTDALNAVVSLSELLRRSLAGQADLQTPLRAELSLLEHYVAIERLRFRDRLRVTFTIAPDTPEALVPGMILQPLVENAVRHGVARRAEAGLVEIESRREGDVLLLEVCDDGPGFLDGWDPETSGGIGLSNTRERLAHLYAGAARFEARNRPGGGAIVTIAIPFQLAGAPARPPT